MFFLFFCVFFFLLLLLLLLLHITEREQARVRNAGGPGRARRSDSQGHGEIPNDKRRAIRLGSSRVQLYKNKIKMNLFSLLLLLLSKSLLRRLVLLVLLLVLLLRRLLLLLLLVLLLLLLRLLLLLLHITEREQARVRNAGGRAGPT